MPRGIRHGGIIIGCFLLCSCTAISPQTKSQLRKSIDCETAFEDIAALEASKASTFKRRVSLVSLISPFGLLTGLVSHDIDDRAEVANGQFNQRVEDRINSIRYECDLR
jgi:hypothetical protein